MPTVACNDRTWSAFPKKKRKEKGERDMAIFDHARPRRSAVGYHCWTNIHLVQSSYTSYFSWLAAKTFCRECTPHITTRSETSILYLLPFTYETVHSRNNCRCRRHPQGNARHLRRHLTGRNGVWMTIIVHSPISLSRPCRPRTDSYLSPYFNLVPPSLGRNFRNCLS